MPQVSGARSNGIAGTIRLLLLGLVVLGTVGLLLELLLLEHYEDPWQYTPLIVLGLGLIAALWMVARPSRSAVLAFRTAMTVFIVTGLVGLWLHYTGNMEFELELDDALDGVALIWSALRGATPVLAPGSLLQLGLLGWILTYGHPALRT